MNNKTFLENLLKEINEDNVILEAPELVKNPLDRNNNQTDVPEPDDAIDIKSILLPSQ